MEKPQPLNEVNPEIMDYLNQVVMRCLEKDPEDRFRTAADLEKAFSLVSMPKNNVQTEQKKEVNKRISVPGSVTSQEVQLEAAKPDMATILLALLALVTAGGLIPFWLYVILSINSINR